MAAVGLQTIVEILHAVLKVGAASRQCIQQIITCSLNRGSTVSDFIGRAQGENREEDGEGNALHGLTATGLTTVLLIVVVLQSHVHVKC